MKKYFFHQNSSPHSPDENKKQKQKNDCFFKIFSILLINLSQTAYFHDLTIPNCRKLNPVSTGMNIIFIRAIGCSFMPGEGPISVRPGPARSKACQSPTGPFLALAVLTSLCLSNGDRILKLIDFSPFERPGALKS